MKDRPIPSSEAMLDVKAAVERTIVPPGEELLGILVLAVSRNPRGKRMARTVAITARSGRDVDECPAEPSGRSGRPQEVHEGVNGTVTRSVTRRAPPSLRNRL